MNSFCLIQIDENIVIPGVDSEDATIAVVGIGISILIL